MITLEGKEFELRFSQGVMKSIWKETGCNDLVSMGVYLQESVSDIQKMADFAAVCAFHGGKHNEGFPKSLAELEELIFKIEQIQPAIEEFATSLNNYYGIKPLEENAPTEEVEDGKK